MTSHRGVATAFIIWLLSSGEIVIAVSGKFGRRPIGTLWYEETRQHRSVFRDHRGHHLSAPCSVRPRYHTRAADSGPTGRYHRAGHRDRLKHSDGGRSRPEPGGHLSSGGH